MKFQRIIEAVYFQPWSITREGWLAIHAIIGQRLSRETQALDLPKSTDDDTDFFGNPMPKMEIDMSGVAMIPICGPLIQHASMIEKKCGACSYDDIKANVKTAMNTPGLKKVCFCVDSPGGACVGMQETATLIDQCSEMIDTEACTDSVMASAALNIVAGCRRIRCTPTAIVGSIGAMSAMLDESLAYQMQGLKVELFASGEFKGMGTPGTSLSDKQRETIMERVMKYADMFKGHVRVHRVIEESAMQGQVFVGSDAVDAGLVDALVDDIDVGMEMPSDMDHPDMDDEEPMSDPEHHKPPAR